MGRKPKLSNQMTLRSLIADKGMTQEQFAQSTGISRAMLFSYMNKEKIPGIDKAIRMAESLGVSLKVLFKALGYDVDGIPDDQQDR